MCVVVVVVVVVASLLSRSVVLQCGFGLKKEFCDKFCSFGIVVAAAVERDFFFGPLLCKVRSLSFFFVCSPSIISCRMLLLFFFSCL